MSKDNAFTPANGIIELTDIVEEGKLPNDAANKSDTSFEDELDALFGDTDSDDGNNDFENGHRVDPNEELSMPDMSDVDDLLKDLNPADHDTMETIVPPPVEGMDEILADILPDDPPDIDQIVSEATTDANEIDDLDALLAEMGNEDGTAKPAAESSTQAQSTMQAEPEAQDDIEDLIASMDAKAEAKPAPKDPAAKQAKPEPEKLEPETLEPEALEPELKPAATGESNLEELDALIDDIMSPNDAPEAKVSEEAAPNVVKQQAPPVEKAEEVEEITEVTEVVEEDKQPVAAAPTPEAEPQKPDAPAPAATPTEAADLDSLTKQLTDGPLLVAIQNIAKQEVERQLDEKLKELEQKIETQLISNLDKAAASAAAKVIREEIAALAQVL